MTANTAPGTRVFNYKRKSKPQAITVNGQIKTDNAVAVHELLRQGAGIGVLSDFIVEKDIARGNPARVLPDYSVGAAGVYAVCPDRKYKLSKVQMFVDFLAEGLQSAVPGAGAH